MSTLHNEIEDIIKNNATTQSINRAKSYSPSFDSIDEQGVTFRCRGSASKPYTIKIILTDDVRVRCSCPYDGEGMCKHSIASLRMFAKLFDNLEFMDDIESMKNINEPVENPMNDLFGSLFASNINSLQGKTNNKNTQKVNNKKTNKQATTNKTAKLNKGKPVLSYPLTAEGHIDFELIIKDMQKNGYHLTRWNRYDCQITEFKEHEFIKTQSRDYSEINQQTFIFDKANNSLVIDCNCEKHFSKKTAHCVHLLYAVDFIAENMGSECLTENYFLNKVNECLQDYGLSTDDDYQDLFEFAIDSEGFHGTKKKEGLFPTSLSPMVDISDVGITANNLPEHILNNKSNEFGIGLVFEFDEDYEEGKYFSGLTCVEGKYDKYRTGLSTRFKKIDEYNFESILFDKNYAQKDKDIFFESLEFNYFFKGRGDVGKEIQQIVQAIYHMYKINQLATADTDKHVQGNANPYPMFAHERGDSYTKKNLQPLTFNNRDKVSLTFQFSEDKDLYHLTAKVKIGKQTLQANSKQLMVTPAFIRKGDEIFTFDNPQLAMDIVRYHKTAKISFIKKDSEKFSENVLLPLSRHYQITGTSIKKAKTQTKKTNAKTTVTTKAESQAGNNTQNAQSTKNVQTINNEYSKSNKQATNTTQTTSTPLKSQVYISEHEQMIFFRLAVQYPDKLINPHSQELRLQINAKGEFEQLPRDEEFEQAFIEFFNDLHSDFAHPLDLDAENIGTYILTPEQLIEDFWLLETAQTLRDNDIELLGFKELKSFKYNLHKPTVSMNVKSDIDWFDVELDISFGEQAVNLKDLQKAFVKKQNYITLSDGTMGMLPETWMEQFAQYFKVGSVKKDRIQISNFQFGVIDELYNNLEDKPQFLTDLYERKQRLQDLHLQTDIDVPSQINAELRPYQQHGLNWLNFLHENRLGGCLADDMGLGKTLQTITFLQHIKNQRDIDRTSNNNGSNNNDKAKRGKKSKTINKDNQQPSIIIAPTSLIFNWQNEVEKFCPTLTVLNFTGAKRMESFAQFADYDIILTTYGSLVKDIETLKDYDFNYVILDESQAIKNPQSQRYKAVRLLRAYNRLILTGTPIENNTFDLYAQFNFLNPGLLGNTSHFRKEFAEAIDKNKDVSTSELLAKLVNPFILRRTKEQVATELPPKVENVMYCEMGSKQRKVYEAVKQEYRDYLLGTINDKGIEKSQMYILEGLMKLRQICNSPAILSGEADYGDESIKLDMLTENIKEKTGQHKILVFSSFVKMLKLIQTRLKFEGIECEYLDGRTRNRQAKVDNFQNNPDVRVFLISTKAGGTGLNLTEADYVFIVDPWWNPAVENQAIDRSYRIGQTKHVMAYRMICKDSIEEKILELQESKKGIAKSIINIDEEKKSFDVEEVKALFG